MHACMQTSQKCWGKHQFTIVISKPSPSTQDFAPSRDEVLIVTKAFEELLQGLQNLGGYLGPESFTTKKQYQLPISSESKFMCIWCMIYIYIVYKLLKCKIYFQIEPSYLKNNSTWWQVLTSQTTNPSTVWCVIDPTALRHSWRGPEAPLQ